MSTWRVKLYRGMYAAVRSHAGRTERVSLRTRDLAEARRRLVDLTEVKVGGSVAETVEAYLTDKDKTAVRAQGLRDAWKQSKANFGHLRPDQITREVCRAYVAYRRQMGRKDATIRKEIEVVRAGLNFFKRGERAVFEIPAQPPAKERFLTRQEARRLLHAARPVLHIRAFIALSLLTGARGTALLELTWSRVDFTRKTIRLGNEGHALRKNRATVPMNRRAERYLRVLSAAATSPYVIEWAGTRVGSVKKGFAAAVARAGLEDVTPHTLRHTAASWMAIDGVPMFEISKYLGHSDSRITERRYAHLHPDHLRRAAKSLGW